MLDTKRHEKNYDGRGQRTKKSGTAEEEMTDIIFSFLWVSHTRSASDWCALQEALYKWIQYNTINVPSKLCAYACAHRSQDEHTQENLECT